ncbi:unnamed protein product [Symbiodinium natans]|uniref:Uncharacterized protein n=1 Tax=Symbiodinium natans TaxID=878477 RepID=A0A812JD76_9DINO|nr:unnamed protein product [Symbiodinium natans]
MELCELYSLVAVCDAVGTAFKTWTVSQIATLSDLSAAELKSILDRRVGRVCNEEETASFSALVAAAELSARFSWTSHTGIQSLAWAGLAMKQARYHRFSPLPEVQCAAPLPDGAPAKRLRSSRVATGWRAGEGAKDAGFGYCDEQRQATEARDRARWIGGLSKLIRQASLPAAIGLAGAGAERAMQRLGKGRRASTLRKHVRTWSRVHEWVLGAFGVAWPSAAHFVAYLEARAAEPCGRSVPGSCLKSLMFIESAGELHASDKISAHPAVRNCLEELSVELADKNLRGKKQACQLLVSQVCAMERLVVLDAAPLFVRAFAWFKLVKLWGCLRYSDTEGMPARTVQLQRRGLSARLERTKTSGAGKKREVLYAYVSKDAWLVCDEWLACGWKIWCDMSKAADLDGRDFFLARPRKDLDGLSGKMARYCHSAAMSQALFQRLKGVSREAAAGEVPLMFAGIGTLWTEHSERATMRSWADACEVPPAACKQMGRWQPSTDEAYVRSERGNVERAQARVARTIRARWAGPDFLDEESVLSKVADRLQSLDVDETATSVQLDLLRSFVGAGAAEMETASITASKRSDDGTDDDALPSASPSQAMTGLVEDEDVGETGGHLGCYFISIVGSSRRRTLHKGGECHRVPGVHYRNFMECGNERPERGQFDQVCRDCFPSGSVALASSSDEGDVSSASASSSFSKVSSTARSESV